VAGVVASVHMPTMGRKPCRNLAGTLPSCRSQNPAWTTARTRAGTRWGCRPGSGRSSVRDGRSAGSARGHGPPPDVVAG